MAYHTLEILRHENHKTFKVCSTISRNYTCKVKTKEFDWFFFLELFIILHKFLNSFIPKPFFIAFEAHFIKLQLLTAFLSLVAFCNVSLKVIPLKINIMDLFWQEQGVVLGTNDKRIISQKTGSRAKMTGKIRISDWA